MPEEVNEAPVESQDDSNPEQQETQQETFDREYVEKLRAENAKHRTRAKSLETQLQNAKTEAERSKLSEQERLEAEKKDLQAQLDAAKTDAQRATIRSQVAGKVADPDVAMYLIQNDETYMSDDGTVNVDKLLDDKPYLKVQPDPRPGPAPTTAGGSTATGADMNALIRGKAGRS